MDIFDLAVQDVDGVFYGGVVEGFLAFAGALLAAPLLVALAQAARDAASGGRLGFRCRCYFAFSAGTTGGPM